MVSLGIAYHQGEGVEKDLNEAFRWVRKAAEAGHDTAIFFVGTSYENGEGVAKDVAEAVRWYRKAAEAGHPLAMFNLGNAYSNGEGVGKDLSEGVRWYRKAADAGNSDAMVNLGFRYQKGEGISKDLSEAIRWYRKAADAGNAKAMFNLGVLYDRGEGVQKDVNEAFHWYRKAADAGDTEAMFNLGNRYMKGDGVAKDAAEGVRWLRKAAEAGDIGAMFSVGVSYDNGEGVAKDPAEALRWYRKAAEAGHIAAMFNVGVAYAKGEGVEKDVKEAIRWYRKAAEAGDREAMFNLGNRYMKGDGVAKDTAEAVRWYRKAAELGHTEAMVNLGVAYHNGEGVEKDLNEAFRWSRKAAEAGQRDAMGQVGVLYAKGEGVAQDLAEAERWSRKAADAGNRAAIEVLQVLQNAKKSWDNMIVLSDGRHVSVGENGEFYVHKSIMTDVDPVKLTGADKEEAERLLKERQSRPANIPPTIAVPTEPPSSSSPSQTGAQSSAAASPKQSAESRTAGMPPGLEEFEKIPHDPQLLDKLYAGRFDEIGQDKMDLVAVWKGFQDSKVSLNDRSGIQFGPEQMGQMQRYFSDAVMAVEMLISRRVQPNYLKTVTSIQANGGGDSEWAQTTLKNLFRLILQRASGQMPATAEKDWPLMRRSLLNVSDPEILQMAQALTANERAAVEKQMKELGEKGAQVILSEYSDPSEKSSYHRQRLLFWYRDVPVLRRDLLAISNSHPLAELGNLAVTEVPPVLAEAKEKHAEAMAAEGKRVEITPDIDNPEYVGWKGLAPRASATYARNSWIQSGQSKEPTQNGTELRILQSISDANAVVKINEQLGQSVKKETRTFEAKIPDRRDPDERQAPVQEEVELNGRKFKCSRRSHMWKGLEEKATTTIWTSDEVPGGLVRRLVDSEDTHAVHRLSDTTLQSYTGGRNGDWSGKPEGSPLFKTVFSFTRQSGIYPSGRLVEGEDGSFYGTTWDGPMTKDGHWGAGTVFRLSPDGALTTLHTFHNEDGAHPAWGLTKGRDGNLYGTTRENGLAQKGAAHTTGFGTVFKITPSGQFTTLHYFGEPPDGKKPAGELLLASDGNLYGTTPGGGAGGCGTVFRITPSGAFSIVHSFSVSPEEGCGPQGRLVEGPDGSLYGATAYGGRTARHASPGHGGSDPGKGTIFKITPAGELTTLYHFGEAEDDGTRPQGGLTKGSDGSLYGTTVEGKGAYARGTIFKFTPPAEYSVVLAFKVPTDDGNGPSGPLTLGRDGNLYGTTTKGGNFRDRGEWPGNGTVFRFSSAGALTTLHTFRRESVGHRNFGIGEGVNRAKAQWAEQELAAGRDHPEITDGKSPIGGLIEGKDGMLYGTTSAGGIWEFGTIFRVDPKAFKDQ